MKVAGFTFVRNSVQYDYPLVESITSILPICDAFYVLAGNSEDETLAQVQSIASDKIHIYHSVWDETLRKNGAVLARETNKCMDAIKETYDWLFYLQADEVVHEKYLPTLSRAMERYASDSRIEGLLLSYEHFFGSYEYVGDSRQWYRNEIRIIRQDPYIRSYKDAQGFRKNGRKLRVKHSGASIYHYGYMRSPKNFFLKHVEMARFYRNEQEQASFYEAFVKQHPGAFDYQQVDSVSYFKGTQPSVMKKRIETQHWKVELDTRKKRFKNLQYAFLYYFEKLTSYRLFEYKNYKEI